MFMSEERSNLCVATGCDLFTSNTIYLCNNDDVLYNMETVCEYYNERIEDKPQLSYIAPWEILDLLHNKTIR